MNFSEYFAYWNLIFQITVLSLIAVASALPAYNTKESEEVVPILLDERELSESGEYDFRFKTGDGIYRYESGSPIESFSAEGEIAQRGGVE